MNFSAVSIRNPVFAWMLMSAMMIFGAISLNRLGVSMLPDVDQPILDINVTYEGAAPEIMEAEIVDRIEQRVLTVEGIKEVRASVRQGSANIRLEFELSRDLDGALQDVQTALSQIRFPPLADRPIIRKSNPEEDPIMFLGVSATTTPYIELVRLMDTYILDQFQQVTGVGEVQLGGFGDRNLRVWIDGKKLKRYELTVLDVLRALREQHIEVSAGTLETPDLEWTMRTLGEASTVEEVEAIRIQSRGGTPILGLPIRIRDVARVEDGLSEIKRIAKVNGVRALAMSIKKQRGTNELVVGEAVKRKIAEVQASLPDDVQIQVNVDYTVFTEQTVKTTQEKLMLAGIFTALLCFILLGRFSYGFNVGLSIPTSVLGTFMVLMFADMTLNLFTLLALTLAISIIVDDSIMMLENIVRHRKMGKDSITAALDGSKEIWGAAVATSLSVVAIFIPVVFMEGFIGRFFFQFGVTMSTAVMLSLIEAITITPMRCAAMGGKGELKPTWLERRVDPMWAYFARLYRRSLLWALKIRWITIIAAFVFFGASLFIFRLLRQEFVPAQDQSFVFMNFQLAPGTALPETMKIGEVVEAYLKDDPLVEKYFLSVGSGGPSAGTNAGFGGITLTPREQRDITHVQWMAKARTELSQRLKGVRLNFRDASSRGLTTGRAQPVAFNIRGPDLKVLKKAAEEIRVALGETGLMTDADMDFREGVPELVFKPKREAAALAGVTQEVIGTTVQGAAGGVRQGYFTADGRRYDIRVRLEEAERQNPQELAQIPVRTLNGEIFPLGRFVDIEKSSAILSLNRVNRSRAISIFANLVPGASQAKALQAAQRIALEKLPDGYSFHLEGASQGFNESFASIYFALVLGVVTAYMILASQFNSFIHPVTVLLALPFSISGALMALWATNMSVNLYSMIGTVVLMGLAKKNSILLVEFTNHVRMEGKAVREALLEACPIRLRPILLTTFATLIGAIPLAMPTGAGFEARQPMAFAILGGTIVSTILTLYVVPCAYELFAKLEFKKYDQAHGADPHAAQATGGRES